MNEDADGVRKERIIQVSRTDPKMSPSHCHHLLLHRQAAVLHAADAALSFLTYPKSQMWLCGPVCQWSLTGSPMLWQQLWAGVLPFAPRYMTQQDQMPSACPLSHVTPGNIVSPIKKRKKKLAGKKSCLWLDRRAQKMSKSTHMDAYLLLICTVIYCVSFLGLEHQIGKVTHVFVYYFIHNHNERKDRDAHRFLEPLSKTMSKTFCSFVIPEAMRATGFLSLLRDAFLFFFAQ